VSKTPTSKRNVATAANDEDAAPTGRFWCITSRLLNRGHWDTVNPIEVMTRSVSSIFSLAHDMDAELGKLGVIGENDDPLIDGRFSRKGSHAE